jgi:hypothetical protein
MNRFILLLLPTTAAGCTWAEQRWNDFTDVGTVSVSMGLEAEVKIGEFAHYGLGSSVSTPIAPLLFPLPGVYQLAYGTTVTVTEHWPPVSILLALQYHLPMGLHTINYGGIYPYGPVPDKAARTINPDLARLTETPPEHRCFLAFPLGLSRDAVDTHPKDYFDLELGVAIVLGGKVSFCPAEFADFVLGLVPGIDILNDDHHMDRVPKGHYWYKSVPPHPEERHAPPDIQVPPATAPPGTAR